MLENLKSAAKRLRREVLTLYFVAQNPRIAPLAQIGAVLVAGDALAD